MGIEEKAKPGTSDATRQFARYALAVVAVGVAFLLRQPFSDYFGPRVAYITFFPAVMLTAIFGGIGPGLLATALAALLAAFWILPPHGHLQPMDLPDAASLVLFLAIGVFMSILAGLYKAARQRVTVCERELAVQKSEQLRRQAYALLEGVTEGTGDLIAAQDASFRYILFNRAYRDDFRRIFGIEIEVGSSMVGALAHLPEDQQKAVALWNRALHGETFTVTEEFGDPGRQRNVYEMRYSPMHDGEGRQVGAAHIVRDVTTRVRAEKVLRRSEALYRAIARNLPDGGVWVVDPELRYLVVEGGLVGRLGRPREEMEGRTLAETLEAPTRGWMEQHFRQALAGQASDHETEDGGRVLWSQYVPLRDERGEVMAAMALSLDITDRKRSEQELRAAKEAAEDASRAKSEFLANMSHELRTPMTVIMSALEFLQDAGPAGEQRPLLEMADISAHRLLGIIDDLLDISQIETRRLKIETKPFALRDCVAQAMESFAGARDKGLRLSWEVAPQVPTLVRSDPRRLGQVLTNLVGNAVKFTEKGEVTVKVSAAREGLVFTVNDTGIGIPPGKMGALFQPFTQVDGSLTRRYGGTGLGLAICRELVELMGGTIQAQSEPEKGSTFTFTLPLQPEPLTDRPSLPAQALTAGGGPLRVLLAEDEPTVRDLMQMVLSQRGWEVVTSENGRQAVARWEEGGIDLILMDLQMPELDGIAAARTIRAREAEGSRTPIVALTAHTRPEDREECRAAGMNGFLTKPVRMAELYAVIEGCLAGDCPAWHSTPS